MGATDCTVSAGTFDALEIDLGQQIRVSPSAGAYEDALYTVRGVFEGIGVARLSTDGLDRLGISDGADGRLEPYGPHVDCPPSDAANRDEFVERVVERDAPLAVCAPHGGWIEHPTHRQAERVAAELDATEWSCIGYNSGGGAYDRWHVTSTDIDRRSFPGLDEVADRRFEHAVSFHGCSAERVVVGGGASHLRKRLVRDAIAERIPESVVVAAGDSPYAGVSSSNFVNWLPEGGSGVQIEQPWKVRRAHSAEVADAVASVYRRWL